MSTSWRNYSFAVSSYSWEKESLSATSIGCSLADSVAREESSWRDWSPPKSARLFGSDLPGEPLDRDLPAGISNRST